jgi:hypothetical protein
MIACQSRSVSPLPQATVASPRRREERKERAVFAPLWTSGSDSGGSAALPILSQSTRARTMKTNLDAPAQRLPRERVTLMLVTRLLGLAICIPTAAEAQVKQVVEMDMQIRGLNYQRGPDDVTGFISVVAAGGGSHHSVWLTSTNSWVQVGDLPSTKVRFEANRAYSFVCQGAWVYGPLTHVDFSIPCGPFGYTLTIVDTSGQVPDRVLNEQNTI